MALLTGEDRAAYVATMFGRIAWRYDLLNTLMSAGRHHAWRRMSLEMALDGMTVAGHALDVASGTCDFPLSALSLCTVGAGRGDEVGSSPATPDVPHQWIAVDFSEPMLQVGRKKVASAGAAPRVTLLLSDAHALPFRDEAFSLATVGFGMRNFADRPTTLEQIARVLKPGGRLAVLDIFSTSGGSVGAFLFGAAFRTVAPVLGLVFAGDREAYRYLPESAANFGVVQLASDMDSAGLTLVGSRRLAFGSVAILIGEKHR